MPNIRSTDSEILEDRLNTWVWRLKQMWVSRGGYGRVGVAWWVWISGGSARWVLPLSCGGGVTAWVAARFQALTSRFGSFTAWAAAKSLASHCLFFFFFWKASHSLCLALALGFPFGRVIPFGVSFFPFVFPFGLRILESLLGCWVFFFFFLKINLLRFIYLFIYYKWASRLGYNFREA